MTHELDCIFADLGLTQYLDAFIHQGFDAWDIILDIQESDLDALGVKLGHRRKLQRRIANARGIAPSASLASSTKSGSDEKQDGLSRDSPRTDGTSETNGVTKRKYRRHPKPDENAPERPPSAYVLFSNKMREDLKSQNLTFTEIAKLVGENWQSLPPAEKEIYENQANSAKEKYHQGLTAYKKTAEYRKYAQYLHDFKERQSRQYKGQDASKRSKIEPPRLRHGSTSSSAPPTTTNSSASGSSSERLQGSEPPPTRRERVNSSASVAGSQYSSAAPTPMSGPNSFDDAALSPRIAQFDNGSPTDPRHRHSRHPSSLRGDARPESVHQHLPSLSDMLDVRQTGVSHHPHPAAAPEGLSYACSPTGGASLARPLFGGGGPVMPVGRPPPLRHESSSNSTSASGSSGSSGGSVGSYGRSIGEGPLPIHALLSDRPDDAMSNFERRLSPVVSTNEPSAAGKNNMAMGFAHGPSGYGFQSDSSPFQHMKVEQSSEGDVLMTTDETLPRPKLSRGGKNRLDGMDALLRAGEIVGRNVRR